MPDEISPKHRFEVAFRGEIHRDRLDLIDQYNSDLENTVKQSIRLEQPRRQRKSAAIINAIKCMKLYATSLYKILFRGEHWNCQCMEYHYAGLRLEFRLRDQAPRLSNIRLRILLATNDPISSEWKCSDWHDLEVDSHEYCVLYI